MNCIKFAKQFEKEYDFLYKNRDRVAGYKEAVIAFDELLKSQPDFIREFVAYRNDVISSDREAAAFMFAFDTLL